MTTPMRLTVCCCSDCWKNVKAALQLCVAAGWNARTGSAIPAAAASPPGDFHTDPEILSCDVCGIDIPEAERMDGPC
jgi:hypothetical protein